MESSTKGAIAAFAALGAESRYKVGSLVTYTATKLRFARVTLSEWDC